MSKIIDQSLNMRPIDDLEETTDENGLTFYQQSNENQVPSTKVDNTEKKEDMEYARNNLINLIESGQAAFTELGSVADRSQSARAYEVYTNMLKALVEANKDLLDVSERKNPEPIEEPQPQTTNHNHLYIGTTKDLLTLLKEQKSKDNE